MGEEWLKIPGIDGYEVCNEKTPRVRLTHFDGRRQAKYHLMNLIAADESADTKN